METVPQLKVSSDRLVKPWIIPVMPGLLLDFSLTVKAALYECVIRTSQL